MFQLINGEQFLQKFYLPVTNPSHSPSPTAPLSTADLSRLMKRSRFAIETVDLLTINILLDLWQASGGLKIYTLFEFHVSLAARFC